MADNTAVREYDPQRPHLGIGKRICYACGDLGCCLAYSMIGSYLTFFMTDVALIPATTVGTVMLFSKAWDAIIDPFIGAMADKTRTKWGSYRPWVIGASVPMVVTNVLAFTTNPEWSQGFRTIFAFTAYFLSVTAYSALNIPFSSLLSVVTLDTNDRAKMASARETGAMCASLILSFFAQRIVFAIRDATGSEAKGYQIACIIFGIIAMPFFIACFLGTKEVVKVEHTKETYKDKFVCMKKNVPFWCLTWFFIVWGFNALGGGMGLYYYTYWAEKPLMMSNGGTIGSIFMILGTASLTFLNGKFENKGRIMTIFALVNAVATAAKFFLDPRTTAGEYMYYALGAIGSYGSGVCLANMFSIQPDVTEYTRYHHGIYAAGFLSAFTNFCFQFGGAIASAASSWVLGWAGYVGGAATQTPAVMNLIRIMPHFWPAAMMFIGAMVMLKYPLSKTAFNEIVAHLEKGEYAPGVVPKTAD